MELGCSLRIFGSDRVSQSLAKVRRVGAGYVELDWDEICRQMPVEDKHFETLRGLLRENELKVAGVYGGSITAQRDDQLLLQTKNIIRQLDLIKHIGGNLLILTAGARTLENYNCLVKGLREILSVEAAKREMEIAIANQNDTRVENTNDLEAIFVAKLDENIGICADTFYFQLAGVKCEQVFKHAGKRLKVVRISDLMGRAPVVPGRGEVEIKGMVRNLRKAGFDGTILVDHLPGREEKIEKELAQAYAYLQGVIS